MYMNTTETEKDWLHRICGQKPSDTAEKQVRKVAKEAVEQKPTLQKKKSNGFGDVAGMNELKQRVTEGFINILQNRECAEVYGIKPPSMLFYGPAGCGKTFFAEKMAEEVGINFMKIVPDDLACTWVHGTQQKIGEVFKEAEKNAPTLLFFDEFDAMVPRRSGDIDTTHLSELTNGYNCSDISYIVKSAARKKFNETIKSPDGKKHGITQEVLEEIIATKSPSVSIKSLREYERVRSEFSPKDKGLKPVTIGFR